MTIEKLESCSIKPSVHSVYDYDGETLQTLLCQFFEAINNAIDTCNANDTKIEYMLNQGLHKEVTDKMNQFVTDGTFETMINDTLLANINTQLADCLNQYQYLNGVVAANKTATDNEIQTINNTIDTMLNNINTILSEIVDISYLDKADKYKLVSKYGLQENGDITEPLKNCIADIHAGLTDPYIYVPKGNYTLSDTIWNLHDLTIELHPKATITRNASFNIMFANDIEGSIHSGYSAGGNLHWIGGTVDGGSINYMCNPFGFALGENFLIENLYVKNVKNHHAIEFTGCKNGTVRNCRFTDWIDLTDNTRYYAECIQLSVYTVEGYPVFGGASAVGTVTQDILVENCYCDGFPTFVGGHGGVANFKDKDIICQNNIVYNASYSAFRCFKFDNMQIIGNKINFCNRGLYVNGSDYNNVLETGNHVTFARNTCYGVGSSPATHYIDINGKEDQQGVYYHIFDNKFQSVTTGQSVISLINVRIADVHDNDIACSCNGIQIYSADEIRINNNYVSTTGESYGIVVAKPSTNDRSKYLNINNNRILCDTKAIFLNWAFQAIVTSNNIDINGASSTTRFAIKFSETEKAYMINNTCYVKASTTNNNYIIDGDCSNCYMADNISTGYKTGDGYLCYGASNNYRVDNWTTGA